MKIKSNVNGLGNPSTGANHNQQVAPALKIKTNIKAGLPAVQ